MSGTWVPKLSELEFDPHPDERNCLGNQIPVDRFHSYRHAPPRPGQTEEMASDIMCLRRKRLDSNQSAEPSFQGLATDLVRVNSFAMLNHPSFQKPGLGSFSKNIISEQNGKRLPLSPSLPNGLPNSNRA